MHPLSFVSAILLKLYTAGCEDINSMKYCSTYQIVLAAVEAVRTSLDEMMKKFDILRLSHIKCSLSHETIGSCQSKFAYVQI